jgi:hypothetical protein
MRKKWSALSGVTAAGLLWLAATPALAQNCPTGVFVLDLKTCQVTPATGLTGVSFHAACAPLSATPAIAACPASANWKEAVLRIDIPAGCRQANAVVEYQGNAVSWTVNLGDSPTNDGHAGDGGTTDNDAEAYILNETLFVANNGANPDNPLYRQDLALTDSALKLAVKNQFFSWGQPYGFLQTPNSKGLFAIPDPLVPATDRRVVYLGLNRVITGRADRKGCGARRAMVSFQ